MAGCPLRKVGIIDVDIALKGARQVFPGAAAVGARTLRMRPCRQRSRPERETPHGRIPGSPPTGHPGAAAATDAGPPRWPPGRASGWLQVVRAGGTVGAILPLPPLAHRLWWVAIIASRMRPWWSGWEGTSNMSRRSRDKEGASGCVKRARVSVADGKVFWGLGHSTPDAGRWAPGGSRIKGQFPRGLTGSGAWANVQETESLARRPGKPRSPAHGPG